MMKMKSDISLNQCASSVPMLVSMTHGGRRAFRLSQSNADPVLGLHLKPVSQKEKSDVTSWTLHFVIFCNTLNVAIQVLTKCLLATFSLPGREQLSVKCLWDSGHMHSDDVSWLDWKWIKMYGNSLVFSHMSSVCCPWLSVLVNRWLSMGLTDSDCTHSDRMEGK